MSAPPHTTRPQLPEPFDAGEPNPASPSGGVHVWCNRAVAPHEPDPRLAAVRSLAVDAVTVQLVERIRAAGHRSILLKGPAIARWLYPKGGRTYLDMDLLVRQEAFPEVIGLLEEEGFVSYDPGGHRALGSVHASTFVRPSDGIPVDLHRTFVGIEVEPGRAWDILSRRTEDLALAAGTVTALDIPTRTVIVALHAAQHGVAKGTAMADLRRAVERLHHDTWAEAAEIASALGATWAFTRGLGLADGGNEIVARLGLTPTVSAASRGRVARDPGGVRAIDRVATIPDPRDRLRLVGRLLLPRREKVLAPYRGRLGLPGAYGAYWISRTKRFGPALVEWHRVRRTRRWSP